MAITGYQIMIPCFNVVGDALVGRVMLKHLRWFGATTLGHKLIVTDTAGVTIFESVADGDNYIDVHPFYRLVDGIIVATMESGKLYAYLG